ncbi:MAG: UDP-glucose 4-epimerase GalE [Alphaproteobacteria bacterium]|nr:UDP-glucose 4-epimerase GalE [Alphaproteobacteria bacterium]
MRVFVTGGAGYIGSHSCVALIEAGHEVVLYDNLSNSSAVVVDRIEAITGQRPAFILGDVRDAQGMDEALEKYPSQAVIHFAGLKAVGESVEKPLLYYDNNVAGSLRLLEIMAKRDVRALVFSSSATVYGEPKFLPYTESHPLAAVNPYGQTKIVVEAMIGDFTAAYPRFHAGLLRYFNPIGAHESGLIGEDPLDIPNNLFPYIAQVAVGKRPFLNVWGSDYDTPDGTGVRDYIHVVDLALGHVKAVEHLAAHEESFTVNLGTGKGSSVLEVVKAFEKASGRNIPYKTGPRRAGDLAVSYADPSHAQKLLGWRAQRDLEKMCEDGWRWQSQNPNGYR